MITTRFPLPLSLLWLVLIGLPTLLHAQGGVPSNASGAAGAPGAPDLPPAAPVREVRDTYFGQAVVDPYRWMEDLQSPETTRWMRAQADYTRAYIDRLPLRRELLRRLGELSDAGVRVGEIQRAGDRYFYF